MAELDTQVRTIRRLSRTINQSNVLELVNSSMELWYALRKAEDEAEIGQADDTDQDITDLPEVPPQKTQTSSQRAYDALDHVSSLLHELLTDPQLGQQLDADDIQRLRVVSGWLSQGPKTPLHLMKAGDVSLSVKAIIDSPYGTLFLKDAYSDFWDLPGGHVQDGETLDHALKREVLEETGLSIIKYKEKFVKVLKLGLDVKPVVFYDAVVKHGPVILSEEHLGYQWADSTDGQNLNLGVFKEILYPGTSDNSVLRPSRTNQPHASGSSAFTAMLDKGMFGSAENGIAAIEAEHGSRLQRQVKPDGDVLLTCPSDGQMWYVTRDGVAFEYWNPGGKEEKGSPGGGVGMGDELTNSHLEASLDSEDVLRHAEDKISPPGIGEYPGGHSKREDSYLDEPTAEPIYAQLEDVMTRHDSRHEHDYDVGVPTTPMEMTAGGQLKQANSGGELEKEGVPNQSIASPGNGMSVDNVNTPTGGSSLAGRRKNDFAIKKDAGGAARVAGSSQAGRGGPDEPKTPPRPGLVPQTGDWVHPGHWVDPDKGSKGDTPKEKPEGMPTPKKPDPADRDITGVEPECEGAITTNDESLQDIGHDISKFTDMLRERDPKKPRDFARLAEQQPRPVFPRIIKRKPPIPIISQKESVKLMKMIKTDPQQMDMKVIFKGPSPMNPLLNRYIVAGYASPVMVDLEGHKITHEALAADLPRFMAGDGQYANLNVLHSNVTVGKILPEFTIGNKTYKTMVDKVGLFVVAEIRTDPAAPAICQQVIEDIEQGKLRSFSISGNAENPTFTCDSERCFYSINDLQLYEVTLCEEGVNPEAKFDVISKSIDIPESQGGGKREVFEVIDKAKRSSVNEIELLQYFHAFKGLWEMYHNTNGLEVVLFDAIKGEVVLPNETLDNTDEIFPYHQGEDQYVEGAEYTDPTRY
jgi:8-oxo-dGTP diphosphatase